MLFSDTEPSIRLPERLEQLLDPYSVLAETRNIAPVVRAKVAHGIDVWLLSRQADISHILSHPKVSADPRHALDVLNRALRFPGLKKQRHFGEAVSTTDPPTHTRLRRLASRTFTRQRVEAWVPHMAEVAENLITEIRPNGAADLVNEFALPMSLQVVCSILGVPYGDRELIRKFTLGWTQWPDTESAAAEIADSRARLREYLGDLLAGKVDSGNIDLLSDLVRANHGDGALSDAEMVAMAEVLLVNGHDSAAALIANGMFELLQNPSQLDTLRSDPDLIPLAVEELVRFSGPTIYVFRYTKVPVEISGTVIPSGEIICLCIAAGNRDERAFANAEQLEVTRQDNQHIGFGHGIHYCLGAPLARAEALVALSAILSGLPGLRLAARPDELPWRRQIRFLMKLPVSFG